MHARHTSLVAKARLNERSSLCSNQSEQTCLLSLLFRWYLGVSDRSGRGSRSVQKTAQSFPLQKGQHDHRWVWHHSGWPLRSVPHLWVVLHTYMLLCTGEEEEDTSEAMRKFKKAKKKKTVVSLKCLKWGLRRVFFVTSSEVLELSWTDCKSFSVSSLCPGSTWITTLPSRWMKATKTERPGSETTTRRRMMTMALTWKSEMIPPVQASHSEASWPVQH